MKSFDYIILYGFIELTFRTLRVPWSKRCLWAKLDFYRNIDSTQRSTELVNYYYFIKHLLRLEKKISNIKSYWEIESIKKAFLLVGLQIVESKFLEKLVFLTRWLESFLKSSEIIKKAFFIRGYCVTLCMLHLFENQSIIKSVCLPKAASVFVPHVHQTMMNENLVQKCKLKTKFRIFWDIAKVFYTKNNCEFRKSAGPQTFLIYGRGLLYKVSFCSSTPWRSQKDSSFYTQIVV